MDVIGPAQFKKCLGFLTLVHGLSVATFFPVGGESFLFCCVYLKR